MAFEFVALGLLVGFCIGILLFFVAILPAIDSISGIEDAKLFCVKNGFDNGSQLSWHGTCYKYEGNTKTTVDITWHNGNWYFDADDLHKIPWKNEEAKE